jgi:hypothetical protein
VKLLRRSGDSALSGPALFDERLTVPLWWWIPALGVVGLVAFEVNLGHPGVPLWLPVALVGPLVAAWLHRLGRIRVSLVGPDSPGTGGTATGDRTLKVGSASLPVRLIAGVRLVEPVAKQQALGPDLDHAAYLVHRPWVGPMLRVDLDDPLDPTPYWLFSVRHPEPLIQRLGVEPKA